MDLICAVSFGAGARVGSLLVDEHLYAFSLDSAVARLENRRLALVLLCPGLAPSEKAVAVLSRYARTVPLIRGLCEDEKLRLVRAGAYTCVDLAARNLGERLREISAAARWGAGLGLPQPAMLRR